MLRIVVASPGDVQAERDALPAVVDEVNRNAAGDRGVWFTITRWETDAYAGFHADGPQGLIDAILRVADCDVFIGIFWKRFGTPTKDAPSGTAHEFQQAYEAWKRKGRPQIMFYFKQKSYLPKTKGETDQWGQVIEFKENFPKEGLWWAYRSTDKFAELVRNHLTNFLRDKFPLAKGPEVKTARGEAARPDDPSRGTDELIAAYRAQLAERISKVYIVGESRARELEKVFVELSISEEFERPSVHAAWLGMMDAELRRRRDILARRVEEREAGPEKKGAKSGRVAKPDDLLRERTRAVIAGAPGCGKTTLIKYLALKTLGESQYLPVLLELKSINQQSFAEAGGDLVELLFEEAVAGPLPLRTEEERERLKTFFLSAVRNGEAAIFLDGLDEVRGEKFFPALCKSVNAFTRSAHSHNILILTARPYALETRFEGLTEMEIAPLSPRQVQDFLNHYYGDELMKQLAQQLRRRQELSELVRIPFLLGVIAELYRQQGEIVGARLEIYRQIVNRLVVRLDKEKNVERFFVKDENGLQKRALLKKLAYERLFVDPIDKDIERLVFTDEEILEKARRVCPSDLSATDLVFDVIATPLLREVGTNTYAFAHLTIQEYLVAETLSDQSDCEKIFCRNIFEPNIAALEVLPMTLGCARNPDRLYAALEQLPESLTLTNLRLRLRGLAYARKIDQRHLARLTDQLLEMLADQGLKKSPYLRPTIGTLAAAAGNQLLEFIVGRFKPLLGGGDKDARRYAAVALGLIGDARSLDGLLVALGDEEAEVRAAAAAALGQVGDKRALDGLLSALLDGEEEVQTNAAEALGEIGDERAFEALLAALKSEGNGKWGLYDAAAIALKKISTQRAAESLLEALHARDFHWYTLSHALVRIGGEHVVNGLVAALQDNSWRVRQGAAELLGRIGDTSAVDSLLTVLQKDEKYFVRSAAATALGNLGDPKAVDTLLAVLGGDDEYVRSHAAGALGEIGDARATDGLLAALNDSDEATRMEALIALGKLSDRRVLDDLLQALRGGAFWRWQVPEALGAIGDKRAVDDLRSALSDRDESVRWQSAKALGKIGDTRAVKDLLSALSDTELLVSLVAAESLGKIGGPAATDGLLVALTSDNEQVRMRAASALGGIGGARVVSGLLRALDDKDAGVQWSAAFSLGKISDEELALGLEQALSAEDGSVRRLAASFVGYYVKGDQVLEMLSSLSDADPADEVRRAAGDAKEKYERKLQYFS